MDAFKRLMNDMIYVCGVLIREIPEDDIDGDKSILENIHIRENLSCTSNIEIPYYSAKIFKPRCIICGTASIEYLLPNDPMFYPQCSICESPRIKIAKRKTISQCELAAKKQKTLI